MQHIGDPRNWILKYFYKSKVINQDVIAYNPCEITLRIPRNS